MLRTPFNYKSIDVDPVTLDHAEAFGITNACQQPLSKFFFATVFT
jgi:hypothetical protein